MKLLLILFFLSSISFATDNPGNVWLKKTENKSSDWTKYFGGEYEDGVYSILKTTDDGYVIAGYSYSFCQNPGSDSDAWLIKTNTFGVELWNRNYGGKENDWFFKVRETKDGYIAIGGTKSIGAGNVDAWLVKTDKNGRELWNQNYGNEKRDIAYDIQQTRDGGYVIVGESDGSIGKEDVWVLKVDSAGTEVWSNFFGGKLYDGARAVLQTKDGGYIVAGVTSSFHARGIDVFLLRLNSKGEELWQERYGKTGFEEPIYIKEMKNGDYLITGKLLIENHEYDLFLLNVDKNGTKKIFKNFGGKQGDWGIRVKEVGKNFQIEGFSGSFGKDVLNPWILNIDKDGKKSWSRILDIDNGKIPNDFIQISDEGYIITGNIKLKNKLYLGLAAYGGGLIEEKEKVGEGFRPGVSLIGGMLEEFKNPMFMHISKIFIGGGVTVFTFQKPFPRTSILNFNFIGALYFKWNIFSKIGIGLYNIYSGYYKKNEHLSELSWGFSFSVCLGWNFIRIGPFGIFIEGGIRSLLPFSKKSSLLPFVGIGGDIVF